MCGIRTRHALNWNCYYLHFGVRCHNWTWTIGHVEGIRTRTIWSWDSDEHTESIVLCLFTDGNDVRCSFTNDQSPRTMRGASCNISYGCLASDRNLILCPEWNGRFIWHLTSCFIKIWIATWRWPTGQRTHGGIDNFVCTMYIPSGQQTSRHVYLPNGLDGCINFWASLIAIGAKPNRTNQQNYRCVKCSNSNGWQFNQNKICNLNCIILIDAHWRARART